MRLFLCFFCLFLTLALSRISLAWAEPAGIVRDGDAAYAEVPKAKLPHGSHFFTGVISGDRIELFVQDLPAGPVSVELGFLDVDSTGPGQHTFSVDINGTLVSPNVDVWSKGGNKPWIQKTIYNHPGGLLVIHLVGVKQQAFISCARIDDAKGVQIASGTSDSWKKPASVTLVDSRSRPYRAVQVGEVPFYNVDHSPVGAWATFIYGMESSGGVQVCKTPDGEGTLVPQNGVIIAVKNGTTERVMPFIVSQKPLPKEQVVTDSDVKHTLSACTDSWQMPLGVSWIHYSPVWSMQDWAPSTPEQKRRFVLPVTWMQYHIDNLQGKAETQMLFSLQQPAQPAQGLDGYAGYVIDQDTVIAVKSGDAELLTADKVKEGFGLDGATSAFCVHVPAGQEKTVALYIAHYKHGLSSEIDGQPLKLMYDNLFVDMNDILKTAQGSLPAAISECKAMDNQLANCNEDDERKFLSADTLHAYQCNTILWADPNLNPVWAVMEGEYGFINTFDLTVDHLFYELSMHPWTVRNELDHFASLAYTDELTLPRQEKRHPGGLGFPHDMGAFLEFTTQDKGASYPTLMTQEELQNWIVCAALYWKKTGDDAWLARNKDLFNKALESMKLRDDLVPAKRDGITKYVSNLGKQTGEITTYDAMDASLSAPTNSVYTAVKSFACYSMLQPVFVALNEPDQQDQAASAEAYTAKAILAHWDSKRQCFPATFDGTSKSAFIIPAIEGLIYPYAMGMTSEVSTDGPNADLIEHLAAHMKTVLRPGVCLDPVTNAWNLSSTSDTTWQSKVYLNQYITENILGMKNDATGHNADAAQFAYQVLGTPAVGWSDQIYTKSHTAAGSRHYPRGVTSALWWLWQPLPTVYPNNSHIDPIFAKYFHPGLPGINQIKSSLYGQIKEGMTLDEVVAVLGPGWINATDGVGKLSWYFDDGKVVSIKPDWGRPGVGKTKMHLHP